MDIVYENESVKKLFSDFNLMKKEIGRDIARAIKKRYDQLRAAANFSIYLSTGLGRPHPLIGDLKGCYSIRISGNTRLIVRPNIQSLDPANLKECEAVIIKGVMDYHGEKNEWLVP